MASKLYLTYCAGKKEKGIVTMLTVEEWLRQMKTKKYPFFFPIKRRPSLERWKIVWEELRIEGMVKSGDSECWLLFVDPKLLWKL